MLKRLGKNCNPVYDPGHEDCVLCAVDCWDGPDGDPVVQHGYTLTSKIPFRAVIETINKYAFVNNR